MSAMRASPQPRHPPFTCPSYPHLCLWPQVLNLNRIDDVRNLLAGILAQNTDGVRLSIMREVLRFANALQFTIFLQLTRADTHDTFITDGLRQLLASHGSNIGLKLNSDLAQNVARHGALVAIPSVTLQQLKRNQESDPAS